LLKITSPPLRLDSQVKYAVLARGQADIYLRLLPTHAAQTNERKENIWDHATGHILLQEAGGTITDMHGLALDFTHGTKLAQNRGVVASSGRQNLHDHLLKAIAEVSS